MDAFNLLTGNSNQLIILEFKRKSCSGGGGGDDDDDDDALDDDDDSDSSGSSSEGEGNCDTELSRVARLICGN